MVTTKEKEKIDMQAMMKTYKELGTPGPQHKLLAKFAGNWSAKVKNWVDPDKPPVESVGKSENKMIYEGRYLQGIETG